MTDNILDPLLLLTIACIQKKALFETYIFSALTPPLILFHFQVVGARRTLASKWNTPALLSNMMFGSEENSIIDPETPSKSLLGTDTSDSMLFSPTSILKVSILTIYRPSL